MSVSATMPEITTEITIVTANCLYISPVMPPTSATGMNTAHNTATIAMSAPVTCCIALSAATRGETFSCAMIRSTFSITTMASSTTMPIASVSPKSVSRLMVKPSTHSPRKVPMIDTGTASSGMIVERQFCRKTKTTRVTSAIAMSSVFTTSWMDVVTKGVVSKPTSWWTPAGNVFASSAIRLMYAFRTASALAPGRRYHNDRSHGLAVVHADEPVVASAEPHRADVRGMRSTDPSGRARMMMFANSSGVLSRPTVVTGRVSCVPAGAGSRPTDPAGLVLFCSFTAALMSETVTPSCAILSGSSSMFIAKFRLPNVVALPTPGMRLISSSR